MRLLQPLALIFTLITVSLTQQNPAPNPGAGQRTTATPQAATQPSPTPTPLPPPTVKIDDYRAPSGRIIGAALTSDRAYARLAYLTDNIGNRLSGSKSRERAIEWALAEMKRDGHDHVRGDRVMVPHWVRGEESLTLTNPVLRQLTMLGLGNSIGTPPEGITAEAIVVRSFAELDTLGKAATGKIVVYNVPFTNYGAAVQYRLNGASRAAEHGAVARQHHDRPPVGDQRAPARTGGAADPRGPAGQHLRSTTGLTGGRRRPARAR